MEFIKGHWQLVVLTALVFVLWNTPIMTPLKILIVFLHELSHVIATVLTGGEVVSLTISPEQGGLVQARGGSRFIALSSGYLGSLLIGVGLLFAALRTNADRLVTAGLGLLTLVVAALYIRSGFAFVFASGIGIGLLALSRFFGHAVNDLMLRIIGLTSMIYVPFDIFSDTISRSHIRSDARMLAEEFGGATLLWGGIWLMISLCVIAFSLRFCLGRSSNIALPGKG